MKRVSQKIMYSKAHKTYKQKLNTYMLRGCNSVDTFKKKLKTMLFKKHY